MRGGGEGARGERGGGARGREVREGKVLYGTNDSD